MVEEDVFPRIHLGFSYGRSFSWFMLGHTKYTLRSAPPFLLLLNGSRAMDTYTAWPSRLSLGLLERYGYVFVFTCVATDLLSQLRQLMPKTATLMRVSLRDNGISFETNQLSIVNYVERQKH